MCTSSDEGPPPPSGSCGRAGQATAQCPASQTPTVRIRAADGVSPPCTIVPVGQSIQLCGVPSQGSGTYLWSTASTRIRLENTQSQTVTVRAGNQVSPSRNAETVRLRFTPTGCAPLPEVTIQLTVIRVRFSESTNQTYGYDDMDADGSTHHFSIKKNYFSTVKVTVEGGGTADDLEFVSDDTTIARPANAPSGTQFDLDVQAFVQDKAETLIRARAHCQNGPECAQIYADVYQLKHYWATVAKVWDSRSTALRSGANATSLRFPNLDVDDAETKINSKWKAAVAMVHLTNHGSGGGAVDVRYDLNNDGKLTYEIGVGGREIDAINAAVNVSGQKIVIVRDMVSLYYLRANAAKDDTSIRLKSAYNDCMYLQAGDVVPIGTGANREDITITAVNTNAHGTTLTINPGLQHAHTTHHAVEFPAAGWSGNPIIIMEGTTSEDEIKWTMGHELGHSLLELVDVDATTDMMHFQQGATDHRLRYKPLNKHYDPGTENQWDTIART